MLQVENISGGYGKEPVVKSVTFHCQKRRSARHTWSEWQWEIDAVERLFQAFSRSRKVRSPIDGKDASAYSQKEFARKVAVLPQLHAHAFSHSVRETVELGRYPHQSGLFSSWSA